MLITERHIESELTEKYIERARQFFRGVYGGDPAVVDALVGDDIVARYPIFASLFNTPTLCGRKAVKDFAKGFSQRWRDAQITFNEAFSEGTNVVLVWSFRAQNEASDQEHSCCD